MNRGVQISTRTNGLALTVLALIAAFGAMIGIGLTTTEAATAVTPLLIVAGAMHAGFLIVGSMRWIASSSAPVLAAVVVEAGFSDDPSWIRAIVFGCWWFVAMELSWEAIERRSAAHYTSAATLRRVEDVATVVGIALVVGVAATAATAFAPVRSVAVQAVVLAGLLAAFISLVRHVVATKPAE